MEILKSKREFGEVFSRGRRANGRLLRVTVLDVGAGVAEKVAFVAAKRLGNAVHRNRCKRVLREAARQCGLPISGTRVILFATPATHDAHPSDVAEELEGLMARHVSGRR